MSIFHDLAFHDFILSPSPSLSLVITEPKKSWNKQFSLPSSSSSSSLNLSFRIFLLALLVGWSSRCFVYTCWDGSIIHMPNVWQQVCLLMNDDNNDDCRCGSASSFPRSHHLLRCCGAVLVSFNRLHPHLLGIKYKALYLISIIISSRKTLFSSQ